MATGNSPTQPPSFIFSDGEKANFTRLSRLIVEIGRRVLQDVLDCRHPDLQQVINSDPARNELERLKHQRIICQQQWNMLYPESGIAQSKNFDITLLFLLLRNICDLKAPATGWDGKPLPRDYSLQADLVRLKRSRNELFAHRAIMAMTDDEFDKYWTEIEEALNRLVQSRYKVQIDRLKTSPMDQAHDMAIYSLLQSWEEVERKDEIFLKEINVLHKKNKNATAQEKENARKQQDPHKIVQTLSTSFEKLQIPNAVTQDTDAQDTESQITESDESDESSSSDLYPLPSDVLLTSIPYTLRGRIEVRIAVPQHPLKGWRHIAKELLIDEDTILGIGNIVQENRGQCLLRVLASQMPWLKLDDFCGILTKIGRDDIVALVSDHYTLNN